MREPYSKYLSQNSGYKEYESSHQAANWQQASIRIMETLELLTILWIYCPLSRELYKYYCADVTLTSWD